MKRLLDIAGLEAGKILMHRERISLGSLLEECRAEFPDGAKRIFISMAGEQERTGEYYGDPEWLKEVFCNILKNALEHSGGDEPVEVTGWRTEEGIKIAIRDHGKGISEADLPHIFDRFYPVGEEKHSHTGIGLNLAKLIIEKHFGTIKADNYENGGAVFSIVLPDYGLKNEKIE
jgi:signal transduction histidine kinase